MASVSDVYVCTDYSSDHQNECHPLGDYKARVPEGIQKLFEGSMTDPMARTDQKEKFLERPPACGFTPSDIAALKAFDAGSTALGRDKQKVFRMLRERMMRQMVLCDGASTVSELAEALEKELAAKNPSPVPSWYRLKKKDDPLKTPGLKRCCARGCFKVESQELKMKKCAKCIAPFCSARCQTADWKDRQGSHWWLLLCFHFFLCVWKCVRKTFAAASVRVPV